MTQQTWVVVDVEADGPVPPTYSMVSFGAVLLEEGDARSFYGQTSPISEAWKPEALAISGTSREEHLAMPAPADTMNRFVEWLEQNTEGRPILVSDNSAFDTAFINYYMLTYVGHNPFGHSARRIGDLWAGFERDVTKASQWRRFRRTKHTHHPVDDARGNVEALLEMRRLGLRFPGELKKAP